ncbi:MAG: biopolymer transporter ExbD [Planctomycetota bacterium]
MQLPRLGSGRSIKLNVTPLIDVVFLLIIFFLVSSHLARQETQLQLQLPVAASGKAPADVPFARVTINVLADGQLLLGTQQVANHEVCDRLIVERQETSNDLEVRIRADRNIAYRYIEPLLLACAKAEIWNVSFAVIERQADARR